jgi:hypothetical protein
MPTIDVSDEQQAFLRALRDELQNEVQYGSVREQDALQYLIDHFEGGGELDVDADVDVAAGAVSDEESGTSADGGAVAADAGGDADAAASTASDDDGDGGADASGSSSGSGPTPEPDGDGDDRLNAMMNLLDTHDDKWREASKEDARYEIDMPDGTTEYVQTKDDVRAHIFKNYD